MPRSKAAKAQDNVNCAKRPLIMMFADVAKGVVKEAFAESISTIAAVLSFLAEGKLKRLCPENMQVQTSSFSAE